MQGGERFMKNWNTYWYNAVMLVCEILDVSLV